jgi:hypothetical protein
MNIPVRLLKPKTKDGVMQIMKNVKTFAIVILDLKNEITLFFIIILLKKNKNAENARS